MNQNPNIIRTSRLELVALSFEQLQSTLRCIPDLASELDTLLVPALVDGNARRAVSMKIEKMQNMPVLDHPWQTYWLIILSAENTGVGLVGFKGKPDASGAVEIGYGIDPGYQGKGYMTEAVGALANWAFAHPECKAITAHGVRFDNLASQKVLEKNGFAETGRNGSGINFILLRKNHFSSL